MSSDKSVCLFSVQPRRRARDAWVFGIVSTKFSPALGYFQVVERRDIAHTWPHNLEVYPTGNRSQQWWLGCIQRHGTAHKPMQRVVVHARHIVDTVTGVHTQEIESCWNTLKLEQKTRRSIRKADLQSYLDKRMWHQWRGGHPGKLCAKFSRNFAPSICSYRHSTLSCKL